MLTKYNGETMRWVYGLAFFLVVIGLSRFLEFPPNFTPIIAGAVFLPFICSCLLYTSPSPRDGLLSRMPSSA